MTEIAYEKQKLKDTLSITQELIATEKEDLEELIKKFIGDREELWAIADRRKIHIANLETSLDKPYFARIDFTFDETKELHTIYIGKHGIMKDTDVVVTDWRAPISSLYYDAEIGNCSFDGPEGTFNGTMSLKRQFEIENGELLQYFDVDLVSNDQLLQKYLNANNDNRLKSIVSTIQKEQNDVIRRKLFENLIIQGVAGSGKTTVALHRIAYLVYNYMKTISQNSYLVIGPNPVFIKYIKSVLPDLDVTSVTQCTYEDFTKNYIDEEIIINSSDKKVAKSIAHKNTNDIDKFKCSIKYKEMLRKFLEIYILNITKEDLKIGDFVILSSEQIRKEFNITDNVSNIMDRIEVTIKRLLRVIEDNISEILSRYNDYTYEIFKNAPASEKDKLRKKFAKESEELNKGCRSTLRKYFSKANISVTKLYKLFISTVDNYDIFNYEYLGDLKKETLANIKNNCYDFEDLAALIFIKSFVSPNKEYSQIKHAVIDEAQDLGEFNFFALRKALPTSTFSIFGDLAQSIYDYRGIDNWDSVNEIMFKNNGSIINFNKSYRTTAEIMEVADEVASSIGLNRSELVVRHGNDVAFTQTETREKMPEYILSKIKEYKEKGYKTIAVISKSNLLSNYINDDLSDLGLKIPNVSVNDDLTDERFSVCTISNQLAKGLEFDAVIINGADEAIYRSDSELDMKLLYVSITRALHELDIVYSGELTKPLEDFLKKKMHLN